MKSILIEEMTAPQVRAAIDAGYQTAIVTAGSIEQHGKHLALRTDTSLGYWIAIQIADGLGDALVAPVIRPGCSDHHLGFPGTLSISPELLQELCRTYCRNLCQHGLKRIALIPSHGGNFKPMEQVAHEIDAELPCKVAYVNVLRYPKAMAARAQVMARFGITPEEGGFHSGFFETSMMLASPYPQGIDMPSAERGFVGDVTARLEELMAQDSWNITDISPIGVLGDPTLASKEAGRALADALFPIFVEAVREALGYEE